MFVPLHLKSDHSLGYGTASVTEWVQHAADLGFDALALTDLENLYGQVRFHQSCHERGIRPITGVELRPRFHADGIGTRQGRLVLLARDRQGYEGLCRIVSRRRAPPVQRAEGDDPVSSIEADGQGLFLLSDDPSAVRRLLARDVDPASVRLLLVRPSVCREEERGVLQASQELGIPVVADVDAVLRGPADHPLHVLQVAIRRHTIVSEVAGTSSVETPERWLPDPGAARALFDDVPAAVAESRRIAEACDFDLSRASTVFPAVPLPTGETSAGFLARRCRERLEAGRRQGRWPGEGYELRLREELEVIARLGFSPYFLAVAEIVDLARSRRVEVVGRGSAVGSLVAHLLGITSIDPVANGLFFERFIHPERLDLPDIDIDLCSVRRDEVIDSVFERFGRERAAMVSAHQTFRRRSAFREGLKALGMPLEQVERCCAHLPSDHLDTGGVEVPPRFVSALSERDRRAVPLLQRLIGRPHHLSVHPSGLVIADDRLDRYAPLEQAPKGVLVTQYDMQSIEKIGLVKIDLLGNRCLSEIQETLQWVAQSGLADHPIVVQGIAAIPDGDPQTLQTLNQARTIGCFQLETPAMRAVLSRLPIRNLAECTAALAIVRPGPASGDAKSAFIRRARGEEHPSFPHPLLHERLEATYGLFLYDEDIMAVISALAGVPLWEADVMRSAIIRSQADGERIPAIEQGFLQLAQGNGVDPSTARAVWGALLNFASYSFSKAHASSYAALAYHSAFLKTHFPVEYGCSVLNNYGGMYPLRTVAADLTRWGVRILGPCVNASDLRCTVERDAVGSAIRVGLERIKHLRRRSKARLLSVRRAAGPFQTVGDLLERVPLLQREVEALVLSGACDALAPLSAASYPFAHEQLLQLVGTGPRPDAVNDFVPRLGGPGADSPGTRQGTDTYRSLVRIWHELRFLEMHLRDHPMRVLRGEANRYGCLTTRSAAGAIGSSVRIAAIVAATRRLPAGGGILQFVTFEDEEGMLEGVITPAAYATLDDPIRQPGPFLVCGRIEDRQGDVHLRVAEIMPFFQRPSPYGLQAR